MIEFNIIGLPSPQGSKTRMPNGAMLDGASKGARERHRDWRTTVAQTAHDAAAGLNEPMDGALSLIVEFRFPMPKSRPKAVRDLGRTPKTSAPDLDKLVRALGDGLQSGGLVHDDARFVAIYASKVEVIGWTGAIVNIQHLTEDALIGGTTQEFFDAMAGNVRLGHIKLSVSMGSQHHKHLTGQA